MLDSTLKTQLRTYFERIVTPIALVASLDDGAKSAELRELLEEIAALSDRISVQVANDNARVPSFAIQPSGVRFAGLPMGHEFNSLVLALLHAGGHPAKAGADAVAAIKALSGEYRFETYFSLSCQNCPDVVQALNLMSVLNPNIQHVAIDGGLFPNEIAAREIMAVPAVFLNGKPFGQGRMSLDEILGKLDTGAAEREGAKLAEKPPFDQQHGSFGNVAIFVHDTSTKVFVSKSYFFAMDEFAAASALWRA